MEGRLSLDFVQESVQSGTRCDALPRHPGIDLQMNGQGPGGTSRCSVGKAVDRFALPDDGGQSMAKDRIRIVTQESGHDEDARMLLWSYTGDREGCANRLAFSYIRDSKPLCACAGEHGSADSGAVSVGIRLHYGEYRSLVACRLNQELIVAHQPPL
jgi:hypothetical protein